MRSLRTSGPLSFFTALAISAVFLFVKVRQVVTTEPFIRESYALSWDNYGYYLHLPATFIYHDVGIERPEWLHALNKKYQPERPFYQTWAGKDNRLVNVYPVGLAIGYAPFFAVAHATAGWFGFPRDGLSAPYQWMAIVAALFYGILGLWLLRRLLLHFFSDRLAAIVLVIIGLGTNLYYYATYDCNLPHIFLFALDNAILLLTIAWHRRPELRLALLLGALLGLITITRPSEIVWVLVPLLWPAAGGWKEKLRLLKSHFLHVAGLVVAMVAVGSVQLFYWKYTSGHWFSFNHSEGFDFFRPFTREVLFSYKKGWLLYTPVMLFAIAGIFLLPKKRAGLLLPVLVFFLANLWFISSWECWWYAGSFSQRPFVQSYGLMALPLAVFLERVAVQRMMNWIFGIVLVFFILLNQFQTWQINRGIIDRELMTKEYYWKVFGKTSVDPSWSEWLEVDRGNPPSPEKFQRLYSEKHILAQDFEKPSEGDFVCDTAGHDSPHALLLDKAHPFGASFHRPFNELSEKDHLLVSVEADVYTGPDLGGKQIFFTFNMTGHRGQPYGYASTGFDTTQAKPGQWRHIRATYLTPHLLHSGDILNFSIWNPDGATVLIDNLRIDAYEPKR